MLLPLLIGDQRRLVLLLLSLPQLPLLLPLDAPRSASTGVYKINFNFKRLKMEFQLPKPHANISFNLWPSSECSFSCHTESEALLDLIGLIRRKEDRTRRKKIEIVKLCTNLMECIYEEPWHFWVVTEEVETSNSQGILSHWVWGGLVDSMAVRQGKGQAVQEYPH